MINSINSNSVLLRPQMQNFGLQKVVNQINANLGNSRNYDIVELSLKAKELLNAKDETTSDSPIINYENSPQFGVYTQAEWTENTLYHQRSGLETIAKVIDYSKARLEYTTSKIDELENFLHGTGTHSDPYMTQSKAQSYLKNYEQSVITNYTEIISDYAKIYSSFIDRYDEYSGGVASSIMHNQMSTISAESLGISDLSNNPDEIMQALERASAKVNEMITNLESAFTKASGGKVWDPVDTIAEDEWTERLESFRVKTEVLTFDATANVTGEVLEIDKALFENGNSTIPMYYNAIA